MASVTYIASRTRAREGASKKPRQRRNALLINVQRHHRMNLSCSITGEIATPV